MSAAKANTPAGNLAGVSAYTFILPARLPVPAGDDAAAYT